jgi:hypothetical protein
MAEDGGGRWRLVEEMEAAGAEAAVSLVSIFTVNILI